MSISIESGCGDETTSMPHLRVIPAYKFIFIALNFQFLSLIFQIAAYKIPKYIQFVDDFPRTATGKVMKFQLRKNLEKQLNLTS